MDDPVLEGYGAETAGACGGVKRPLCV